MPNINDIISKIGKNPDVRDFGLYESYKPETIHKNVVYYATDRRKIYLNNKEYGSGTLDESVIEEFNSKLLDKVDKVDGKTLSSNDFTDELKEKLESLENYDDDSVLNSISNLETVTLDLVNSKVDKVNNKLLSTEDFTTILKNKLESLENYNDTDIQNKLDQLKTNLDTILGSDDTDTVINTFIEIENFLQGITNTETLTGLLQEMKSEIISLCGDTYLPLSEVIGGNGKVYKLTSFPNFTTLVNLGYNTEENKTNTEAYLKGICKWVKENQNDSFLYGVAHPNSRGFCIIYNYGDMSLNDDGTVKFISGLYQDIDGKHFVFGYSNSVWFFRTTLLKPINGTSSQFLKADGSADNTAYLPTSGGTISGTAEIPLFIDTTNTVNSVIQYKLKGVSKAYSGYNSSVGAILYNYTCGKALGIKDDGTPRFNNYQLWHEGNDGANSGLDADLLDGKHDGALTAINLKGTNSKNLNPLLEAPKYDSLSLYTSILKNTEGLFHANSAGNAIIGINRYEDGAQFSQIGFSDTGNIHYRCFTSKTLDTTTAWKQLAFTDSNVASADKLTTKQLTNEDLNEIKDVNFSSYFAHSPNNVTNKPDGINGFGLTVSKWSTGGFKQCIFHINGTYVRYNNGSTWTPWKKMLTEDDITSINERLTAIESKLNN